MPNPPGANPLVAERAFPTSDDWGCTGVARCVEEMTVESVGISNRLLTSCHTRLRRPPRGPFSYQGVSTRGVRHSPAVVFHPSIARTPFSTIPWCSPEVSNSSKNSLATTDFLARKAQRANSWEPPLVYGQNGVNLSFFPCFAC